MAWLELVDDAELAKAISGELPRMSESGSLNEPSALEGAADRFALRLPLPRDSAVASPSAPSSPNVGTDLVEGRGAEVRVLGTCPVDAPVRIPCEDVGLLLPGGDKSAPTLPTDGAAGSMCGLWVALGPSDQFDELFKAWLSAWSATL